MNSLDVVVLFGTLIFIVAFGVWKTRGQNNVESYLLGGKSMKWGTIGLSVMATQASAITFISTPGQGFESGLGFVQNYFGLPLAIIIVCAVFIPLFYRLKVYTAYEFLERRFDVKTRYLGASLFLIQRGMAAGITIYAPAIILSTILKWNLTLTIIGTGLLVIIYTVSGGTKAVSITQRQQMTVIMGGMFMAFFMLMGYIGEYTSLDGALRLAGSIGKLEAVNLSSDVGERYTLWTGLTGGLFLALSYFGTDQSQVQRYLGGKSVTESRMGLIFNAILKIPMQFFILLTGVMLYVFYIFYQPPIHFKEASVQVVENSHNDDKMEALDLSFQKAFEIRKQAAQAVSSGNINKMEAFILADREIVDLRVEAKNLITKTDETLETKDADYVFLTFILDYLPHGLIGLLMAVIFSAAMSSTSSELNALASTSSVDFYKRAINPHAGQYRYFQVSRYLTFFWGVLAVSFALLANNSENLIEAVNIIGSLFYGTILGIFLVAFFLKRVNGNHVFYSALIAQAIVFLFHLLTISEVISLGYLWYNVIGCGITVVLSFFVSFFK